MKKAIKKTCVVLLLFALLASQVAASYSETGTLNEGTSAISAAERYLSNWAYNSYMYADKNLTLGTVLDAEVDPAKLTLATSEFMALRNDADGQENNISVAVSKMQANIQFMIGQCVRSEAGRVALDKPGGKRRCMDGFDLFVPVIDSN